MAAANTKQAAIRPASLTGLRLGSGTILVPVLPLAVPVLLPLVPVALVPLVPVPVLLPLLEVPPPLD